MGGGGQSNASGAGTYYSSLGEAENAENSYLGGGGSGFNWGTLGSGIQRAGGAIAAGGASGGGYSPTFSGPSAYTAPGTYAPAPMPNLIPDETEEQKKKRKQAQDDLMEALKRLDELSKKSKDVLIPDTGAAKYMYVDPRVYSQGNPDAGFMPVGAQPSF